jgi:hypothetical protein
MGIGVPTARSRRAPGLDPPKRRAAPDAQGMSGRCTTLRGLRPSALSAAVADPHGSGLVVVGGGRRRGLAAAGGSRCLGLGGARGRHGIGPDLATSRAGGPARDAITAGRVACGPPSSAGVRRRRPARGGRVYGAACAARGDQARAARGARRHRRASRPAWLGGCIGRAAQAAAAEALRDVPARIGEPGDAVPESLATGLCVAGSTAETTGREAAIREWQELQGLPGRWLSQRQARLMARGSQISSRRKSRGWATAHRGSRSGARAAASRARRWSMPTGGCASWPPPSPSPRRRAC